MAITATFKADFSSFATAVDKAQAQLRSFETGASKVEKSLSRMTDSFSGRRVIQEATLTAKAIEEIGGVSRLTESELKRVASQAQEAAAKLKAMGMDVPPGIQKIADATKNVDGAFGGLKGALGSVNGLLGAFGVGLSVSAVVGFGKALLDDADALVKMSDKTGISIQGLQRLQVAGDDAGNSIEEMSSAINQMQNRLAGGDASATGALQKLGMSFADIKSLSPDKQFMAISDALRGVEDPAQQVAIAMDLFGKSGASVLPTLKRGFDDVRDSAVGMSEDTARALEQMGTDFQAFYRTSKNVAAGVAVELYRVVQDGLNPLTYGFNSAKREVESWKEALDKASESARNAAPNIRKAFGAEVPGRTEDADGRVRMQFVASEAALLSFNREMAASQALKDKDAAAAKRVADEYAKFADVVEEVIQSARNWRDVLDEIDGSVVDAIRYYRQQGVALDKLATVYGLTAVQAKAVEQSLTLEAKMAQASAGIHANLATEVWNLDKAFGALQGRQLTKIPTLQAGPNPQLVGQTLDFERGLKGVSEALALISQIGGEAFGKVERAIGSVIAQMNLASQAFRNFTGVAMTAGQQGAAAMATVGFNIIAMLGENAQRQENIHTAIVQMWMDSSRVLGQYSNDVQKYIGRDVIQAYQDAIRNAHTLADAQARVNDLMSALNTGQNFLNDVQNTVGLSQTQRNADVKRAKEILDYVNAAQQRYKDGRSAVPEFSEDQVNAAYLAWQRAMAAAGDLAAQAWLKTHEAAMSGANSVNAALDALQTKRDGLAQSIANEAPEEVMGVIEAQTRGQIAALDAEMEAQRAAMKASAEDGASAAVVAIEDEFSGFEIHVPVIFDIPRVPGFPMEQPEPVPGASTGARVLPFGLQHLAVGGFARGTDTVPAMLTPGELVLNAAQQKNIAGALGGTTSVTINVNNGTFDTPAGRDRTLQQINKAVTDALRREKRLVA